MLISNLFSKQKAKFKLGDIPICRNQIEGMKGFAQIIMDKAIELNGGEFSGNRDDYENLMYQIYFDAQMIHDFMQRRLDNY